VLAGGSATRLDRRDKMLEVVDGQRLLDRVLGAVTGARQVIGVGAARAGTPNVRWVRESPPGGGPVAALAAGLTAVTEPVTVLLAADLPFVATTHVQRLLAALDPNTDGAMFVDPDGHDQPLASAWWTAGLRRVLPEEPAGAGLRRVLAPLTVHRLPGGDDLLDCDTPSDLERARRRATGRHHRDEQEDHA
jgi:molybdopterin-guanine dinucleotide biosynthesis protein A